MNNKLEQFLKKALPILFITTGSFGLIYLAACTSILATVVVFGLGSFGVYLEEKFKG